MLRSGLLLTSPLPGPALIEYNPGVISAGNMRLALGRWLLVFSLGTIAAICVFPRRGAAESSAALASGFVHPPGPARPWVYWFWLNGNVSASGITADLEAMQRVGIGGALLMDVDQEIPPGPVRFASNQWHDLFAHAAAEAGRLGLVLSLNNSAGWTGSGGPWITPEEGMQKLVCIKTNLSGPAHFAAALPRLPGAEHSHDIAVLAFPTLVGEGARVPGFAPKLTSSSKEGFKAANLLDDDESTFVTVPVRRPGKSEYLQLEFNEPFKASILTLAGTPGYQQQFTGRLESSEDGHQYSEIRQFSSLTNGLSLIFEANPARFYRVVFTTAQSLLKNLRFSELDFSPIYRIESAQAKSGLGPWPSASGKAIYSQTTVPQWCRIQLKDMRDLTASLNRNGQLVWDIPPGKWTVLRFCYEPTYQSNHPAPLGGAGLECDKLSKESVDAHYASFLAPLLNTAGPAAAGGFLGTHVDSWEVGYQNWTPAFRQEFQRRRGYDPVRYLPAFTGRVVEDLQQSERFLWDMRRTVADLVADNYTGHLRQIAHEHGLELSMEAYGKGPFDDLQCAGRVDVPMAEFWFEARDSSQFYLRPMPSAAHSCGKPVVAAEAFTSYPSESKWLNHPFSLKPLADAAFCEGINRLVFHRYAHQPWLNRRPGMTMGQFGIEYESTQTWWEFSSPWHEYLARCQYLLRQGLFAADLCFLTDEGAYTKSPKPRPMPPPGYDYDLVAPEVLLSRMAVGNGRLVLPDGMSYGLLVLPSSRLMTSKLLNRLKELVEHGAVITGPPPLKSPSLADFPQGDAEIETLTHQLWGNCDGKTITEHSLGKGKVIWGRTLPDILAGLQPEPDFQQLSGAAECPLHYIHRHIGEVEAYFVCAPGISSTFSGPAGQNQLRPPLIVQCRFRVHGKQPELWHPDTGLIEKPAVWRAEPAHTDLPLKFTPGGSLFVMFRDASPAVDPVISVNRNGAIGNSNTGTIDASGKVRLLVEKPGLYQVTRASGKILSSELKSLPQPVDIDGEWNLHFPSGNGAPENIHLKKLASWTENSTPGVRFFSGTATYTKTVQVKPELVDPGCRLMLDLGQVQVMAKVKINGKDCGILWKPPFEADVTGVVRAGPNALEIQIVNLWPNRLIGDEHLPQDCTWQTPTQAGAALARWPSWLLEGKPSPTGRITFTTWKHWSKDSALLESGLIGPVTLRVLAELTFD